MLLPFFLAMNIFRPHRKTEKTLILFYFVRAITLTFVIAPILNTLLAYTYRARGNRAVSFLLISNNAFIVWCE
jgi:hypothetical protein